MMFPVMAHAVEEKLNAVWPPASWRDVRVLVAVSGGADSVALLRAMARIAGDPQRLIVAHFNHRWRGPDSDADARWVEHLAWSRRPPNTDAELDIAAAMEPYWACRWSSNAPAGRPAERPGEQPAKTLRASNGMRSSPAPPMLTGLGTSPRGIQPTIA